MAKLWIIIAGLLGAGAVALGTICLLLPIASAPDRFATSGRPRRQ